MRSTTKKILEEAYNQVNGIVPIKGIYVYFVDGNELYSLKPYKEVEPEGMIMTLANNWRKARIMHGEDVQDILNIQVKDTSLWYEVGLDAPEDHVFTVYIGS